MQRTIKTAFKRKKCSKKLHNIEKSSYGTETNCYMQTEKRIFENTIELRRDAIKKEACATFHISTYVKMREKKMVHLIVFGMH